MGPEAANPAGVFLEAAFQVGARLLRGALWHHGRCNWLGWSLPPGTGGNEAFGEARGHRRVYGSLGTTLYGGTSGIALFLARLYRATGERPFATTAEGALRQALSKLDEVPATSRTSFYAGDLGIAYALVEAGEILQRPEWIEQGLDLAAAPEEERLELEALDVIQGSAGAIGPLLDLHRRHGSAPGRQNLRALAERHGRHLLDHARKRPGGLAWPQEPGGRAPELTGYAHGAAGVTLALMELATHLELEGEDGAPFRQVAREGLGYERHLFQPPASESPGNAAGVAGNWPDLRYTEPSFMVAWCHGAAGIGLARLRILQLAKETADPEERHALMEEVEAALGTVVGQLARPVLATPTGGGDLSLCHGATGLAEFLLEAHQQLGRAGFRQAAAEVGQFGIDAFLEPGLPLPCGTGGESPGLFLGLAGIGHFYLRLARSLGAAGTPVPSVLRVCGVEGD